MVTKTVLVTGGAGYIGSHTVLELLQEGYEVVVVDNLSNSSQISLDRVEEIAGKKIKAFYKVDIKDEEALKQVFKNHPHFHSVVHFAGLKAVGESTQIPLDYYLNNVTGTVILLKVMQRHGVKNIVFSSSATVYGDTPVPEGGLVETLPTSATNPYGRTKLFIEYILQDTSKSQPNEWNVVVLRYFNPVGAHPSGKIGEDPKGIPNNLMPFVTQVAVGKREYLQIFGSDYSTKDGTGVRDYIHVVDLSKGHIAAVKHLDENPGYVVYNLGTGNGSSVLEVVKGLEKACGKTIPYKLVPRRPGDVAVCYASPVKAKEKLHWSAQYNLDTMCIDAWRWQKSNPNGYYNPI